MTRVVHVHTGDSNAYLATTVLPTPGRPRGFRIDAEATVELRLRTLRRLILGLTHVFSGIFRGKNWGLIRGKSIKSGRFPRDGLARVRARIRAQKRKNEGSGNLSCWAQSWSFKFGSPAARRNPRETLSVRYVY